MNLKFTSLFLIGLGRGEKSLDDIDSPAASKPIGRERGKRNQPDCSQKCDRSPPGKFHIDTSQVNKYPIFVPS